MTTLTREEYQAKLGQPIGTSRWYEITQDRIDQFAGCTEDHQYIHIDPARAADSPFGGTIAHGFLTLSMLSAMVYEMPSIEGVVMGVNYGLNKVRFISPVRSGARIRGHFTLTQIDDIRPTEIQTTMTVTVEIEGQEKPALVAEWLGRRYFGETA
ncbi:MaoC family dehydratase [Pseudooceanicola spongiae]|uniref:MaoC family dehydratase n=1 Tax=Pseudooceanicola spongiae TaxID=2613965 RepID=A0A7L9WPW7_9RHOB|nr:MaoC family dehydratase [Pseudooceanicola spongiae]QOL81757.1 MaoC family dehydratase [Pseudooceanicola spongiae]